MMGKSIALQSAMNYRLLQKNGITIRKTIDVIIGTFCIERGFPLLHNDRDFDLMEKYLGLHVYKINRKEALAFHLVSDKDYRTCPAKTVYEDAYTQCLIRFDDPLRGGVRG